MKNSVNPLYDLDCNALTSMFLYSTFSLICIIIPNSNGIPEKKNRKSIKLTTINKRMLLYTKAIVKPQI